MVSNKEYRSSFRVLKKDHTNNALYAIADDMRERKNDGEFDTYREAYEWAANNIVKEGIHITAIKLEKAYHKAKSEGKVGEQKNLKVSIPIMITNQMRMDLSILGYTKDEMKHLTPKGMLENNKQRCSQETNKRKRQESMSVGMTRYDNLWDYPFHKFILCISVAITYWFGNEVVNTWIDGKEIDIVSLLITIVSISVIMGVGKDMIKKIKNQED